jgi:hypothetical protein
MSPDDLLIMLRKSDHIVITENVLDRIFKSPRRVDMLHGMFRALARLTPIKTQKEEIDAWCDKHKVKYWTYNNSLEHHFKLLR